MQETEVQLRRLDLESIIFHPSHYTVKMEDAANQLYQLHCNIA